MVDVARRARVHVHGCGGRGAERGVWVFQGSGTDVQGGGRQLSSPQRSAPKLPAYRRDTHKCWQLVQPARQGRELG